MFLGKLTSEQSETDSYRKFLSRPPEEGDWFIGWDWIEDEEVECVCVFYDSAVCYISVPVEQVKAVICR
jgi:hypothetical protein